MFKEIIFLRSSKCLKTTAELMFTAQKANACIPWTACSVFDWKYFFGKIWSKDSKLSVYAEILYLY